MNPNWNKSKKRNNEELMKNKKESICMTEPSDIIVISDDESDVAECEEPKVSKRSKTTLELEILSDDSVICLDDVIVSSLDEATVEENKIPLEENVMSLAENTMEETLPPDETVTCLDHDESIFYFDVDVTEETVLSQDDEITQDLLLPPIPFVVPPKKMKKNRLLNIEPEEQERATRSLLALLTSDSGDK